jgi:hypothetical protein
VYRWNNRIIVVGRLLYILHDMGDRPRSCSGTNHVFSGYTCRNSLAISGVLLRNMHKQPGPQKFLLLCFDIKAYSLRGHRIISFFHVWHD